LKKILKKKGLSPDAKKKAMDKFIKRREKGLAKVLENVRLTPKENDPRLAKVDKKAASEDIY